LSQNGYGGKGKCAFLSESCDEPALKKLVQGLCLEKGIHLVNVSDSKKLGEFAGLCKIDKDGLPRKVVGSSCVVITDFGEDNDGLAWLQQHEFK
jgi:small subunit ribosomal protein S12e